MIACRIGKQADRKGRTTGGKSRADTVEQGGQRRLPLALVLRTHSNLRPHVKAAVSLARLQGALDDRCPGWTILSAAAWRGSLFIHLDLVYDSSGGGYSMATGGRQLAGGELVTLHAQTQRVTEATAPESPTYSLATTQGSLLNLLVLNIDADAAAPRSPAHTQDLSPAHTQAQDLSARTRAEMRASVISSTSDAVERLEGVLQSLDPASLVDELEPGPQDEKERAFTVVKRFHPRSGLLTGGSSTGSLGRETPTSPSDFQLNPSRILLQHPGQQMKVQLTFRCDESTIDSLRVIVRHAGPPSVLSLQHCQQYYVRQLTRADVSRDFGAADHDQDGPPTATTANTEGTNTLPSSHRSSTIPHGAAELQAQPLEATLGSGRVKLGAVLTVHTAPEDLPGLLWVELWHGQKCCFSHSLLLLREGQQDWLDELDAYLVRLEQHHLASSGEEGLEAMMPQLPTHAAMPMAGDWMGATPVQQLIQDLGRWFAYSAAVAQRAGRQQPLLTDDRATAAPSLLDPDMHPAEGHTLVDDGVNVLPNSRLPAGPGLASFDHLLGAHYTHHAAASSGTFSHGLGHHQPPAAAGHYGHQSPSANSAAAAAAVTVAAGTLQAQPAASGLTSTGSGNSSGSSSSGGGSGGSGGGLHQPPYVQVEGPWPGVEAASLHRFSVESALALLGEMTEAGCWRLARGLMASLLAVGVSLQEVMAATWSAAEGVLLDLPLLHAAIVSLSPEMVDLVVSWLHLSGLPWSWSQQLPVAGIANLPGDPRLVSPLQLAAAQQDVGSIAAHILRTYPQARAEWFSTPVAQHIAPAAAAAPGAVALGPATGGPTAPWIANGATPAIDVGMPRNRWEEGSGSNGSGTERMQQMSFGIDAWHRQALMSNSGNSGSHGGVHGAMRGGSNSGSAAWVDGSWRGSNSLSVHSTASSVVSAAARLRAGSMDMHRQPTGTAVPASIAFAMGTATGGAASPLRDCAVDYDVAGNGNMSDQSWMRQNQRNQQRGHGGWVPEARCTMTPAALAGMNGSAWLSALAALPAPPPATPGTAPWAAPGALMHHHHGLVAAAEGFTGHHPHHPHHHHNYEYDSGNDNAGATVRLVPAHALLGVTAPGALLPPLHPLPSESLQEAEEEEAAVPRRSPSAVVIGARSLGLHERTITCTVSDENGMEIDAMLQEEQEGLRQALAVADSGGSGGRVLWGTSGTLPLPPQPYPQLITPPLSPAHHRGVQVVRVPQLISTVGHAPAGSCSGETWSTTTEDEPMLLRTVTEAEGSHSCSNDSSRALRGGSNMLLLHTGQHVHMVPHAAPQQLPGQQQRQLATQQDLRVQRQPVHVSPDMGHLDVGHDAGTRLFRSASAQDSLNGGLSLSNDGPSAGIGAATVISSEELAPVPVSQRTPVRHQQGPVSQRHAPVMQQAQQQDINPAEAAAPCNVLIGPTRFVADADSSSTSIRGSSRAADARSRTTLLVQAVQRNFSRLLPAGWSIASVDIWVLVILLAACVYATARHGDSLMGALAMLVLYCLAAMLGRAVWAYTWSLTRPG